MHHAAGIHRPAAGGILRRAACVLAAAAWFALGVSVPGPADAASRVVRNVATGAHSALGGGSLRSNETTLEIAMAQFSAGVSASVPTAAPGQEVTFTVLVDNRGLPPAPAVSPYTLDGAARTAAFVLARVPAEADFVSAQRASFYHYAGEPATVFHTAPPPAGTRADAVGLLLSTIAAESSADFAFRVVPRNLPGVYGAGVTLQVAAVASADGSAVSWFESGAVAQTLVRAGGSSLTLYRDATATQAIPNVYAGRTAYVRVASQSCNADGAQAEVRTARVTTSDGDSEQVQATETGPNTGVFALQSLPTRLAQPRAGSNRLESPAGATVSVAIDGCMAPAGGSFLLIDPRGVVFDSATNAPVDGLVVTLFEAAGATCSATLASVLTEDDNGALVPSPNPVTSRDGGRFAFPLVPAGNYCLQVASTADYTFPTIRALGALPPARQLQVGSLGQAFPVGPSPEPVILDLPVDPMSAQPVTLFVGKKPSREVAYVGEQVDFTVTVKNVGTGTVTLLRLRDVMSAGLGYVSGTTRVNGQPVADGAGGARFPGATLPDLAAGATHTISYRTAITPSAGETVHNAASASGRGGRSNTAEARVKVRRGFESDNRGVLTGSVYLACGKDGETVGMPGVRLLLEDGTSITTDHLGRYSRYGLRAGTHVLKVDPATLPEGVRLAPGARGLDFVDLKDGELFKRDIALECTPAARAAATARAAGQPGEEVFKALDRNFSATVPVPAVAGVSGVVASTGVVSSGGNAPAAVAPAASDTPRAAAPAAPASAAPAQGDTQPTGLEAALLASKDNKAAFLNLADGQVLPSAITAVQVRAPAGSVLELTLNGEPVPAQRIGQRSTYPEKAMMGLEFVAVQLRAGANALRLVQRDQFGNQRADVQLKVVAPGELAQVLFAPVGERFHTGDAGTVLVRIQLRDAAGVPVTTRLPVTLTTEVGQWQVPGALEADGAVRVFVEGGEAQVAISQPAQATRVNVTATVGRLVQRQTLDFVPKARPFIAAGVVEGIVRVRSGQALVVAPTNSLDAFSKELQGLSREFGSRGQVGARAAAYLKGKVKGDYLLTLAYDSDKDTRERLFRDITPDEYYPIYGDDSVRAFDAQSTSKLYVRVEKEHSWVLVGDFQTEFAAASGVKPTLSAYNRAVTGGATHLEKGGVALDAFVVRDRTRQRVADLAPNGTSGPYTLPIGDVVPNSERVELVVRDRLNTQVELRRTALTRFDDYEIEELSGRILFRSPVWAFDAEGNPVTIRVTYEVESNQEAFTTAGAQVTVPLGADTKAAVRTVREDDPSAPYTLQGVVVQSRIGKDLLVSAEVARSQRGGDAGTSGTGSRVEAKGSLGPVEVNAVVADTSQGFDNPSAGVSSGRLDAAVGASLRISDNLRAVGKVSEGRDKRTGSDQQVVYAGVEATPMPGLQLEAGVRTMSDNAATVTTGGTAAPQEVDVTTVRGKAAWQPAALPKLSAFVEGEQAIGDSSQHLLAAGAAYQLGASTKVYARHEFANTLPVLSSAASTHQQTAVGFETSYDPTGKVYGELRSNATQGLAVPAAAMGVKQGWEPLPGVRFSAGFERVQALREDAVGAAAGTANADSTAISTALQLNLSDRWRANARLETSHGELEDTLLVTSGLALKLNEEWTALARQAYFRTERDGEPGLRVESRVQLGSAWRSVGRDALFLVEAVREPVDEGGSRDSGIVSVQYGQEAGEKLRLSTRLAARQSTEKTGGLATRSQAALVGARAAWEMSSKWSIAAQGQVVAGGGSHSTGLGLEVGYRFADNLWVVVGYNFMEARDPVLAQDDFSRGLYVRFRYLFDETAMDGMLR